MLDVTSSDVATLLARAFKLAQATEEVAQPVEAGPVPDPLPPDLAGLLRFRSLAESDDLERGHIASTRRAEVAEAVAAMKPNISRIEKVLDEAPFPWGRDVHDLAALRELFWEIERVGFDQS